MKKPLLLLAIFFLSLTQRAQIDSALAAQLQNVLNSKVSSGSDHGVSAHLILQNGKTWSGTAGVNGQSQPITDSTVFHGASTTKLNIAILMLMLQENGLLDLDDSWHKYVPGLNVAFDTTITIRQLLNHTSGIKDYLELPGSGNYVTSNFNNFYTPQYILENIVSGVPDFTPGSNFNYSTSNYVLAALVAEAATGNPVQTELRTRIWNPLGMKHTYFGAYETYTEQKAGVWWNFGSGLVNYSSQPVTSMLSFGYGGANIVSCPTDLALLVNALSKNLLLTPQSMTEMLTFVPQSYGGWWTAGYGLGIHHQFGQVVDTVLGHDGDYTNLTDVFHSNMCGFTLATMSNTKSGWMGIFNPMYSIISQYFMCNATPVANFRASTRIACTGATIVFSDSSANVHPTAWNWSFPGGTLTGGTTANDSMPKVMYANPGTYAVSYTASAAGGSSSITKNAYITVNSGVASYTTAFLEGFETASLPGTDWSISNTSGINWAVTSLGAATGSNSAYIDNFSNPAGNNSSLISVPFDISGFTTPKFTFKMAYQQKASANNDKLQVLTSTDCGKTWFPRWTKNGSALATFTPAGSSAFFPAANQFTTFTVNINAVASSSNVRFKFLFFADPAGPGNNIFIDDINIFDASVGVEELESKIGLTLYPNPSQGNVTIEFFSRENHNVSVIVTDLPGRIVETIPSRQYASGQSQIIIAGKAAYEAGVYLARINIDGELITKKIIIE